MPDTMTVYTTRWCGYCVRLKFLLDAAGFAYEEVDIEVDEAGARRVAAINGGNHTVPTVVLPDGTTLTNPSIAELTRESALQTQPAGR